MTTQTNQGPPGPPGVPGINGIDVSPHCFSVDEPKVTVCSYWNLCFVLGGKRGRWQGWTYGNWYIRWKLICAVGNHCSCFLWILKLCKALCFRGRMEMQGNPGRQEYLEFLEMMSVIYLFIYLYFERMLVAALLVRSAQTSESRILPPHRSCLHIMFCAEGLKQ